MILGLHLSNLDIKFFSFHRSVIVVVSKGWGKCGNNVFLTLV